jgi:dTDP-glucose pyrophosphorylase
MKHGFRQSPSGLANRMLAELHSHEKPEEEIGKFISTGIYKFPKTVFKKLEQLK